MNSIDELIRSRLLEIEKEHNVSILYACESGSRAWGFPSANSDYDVRFFYIHPMEWYLSLEPHRDTIEYPIVQDLDFVGWDIKKTLGLLYKSNPPLLEKLSSPIVYLDRAGFRGQLLGLAIGYYSPQACAFHHQHMAKGNFEEVLNGETVWIKKYFYVLRPLLAIKWIEQGLGIVPMAFGDLVERIVTEPRLRLEIQKLIDLKAQGAELDKGPRIDVISDFIESELERLQRDQRDYEQSGPSLARLDEFFLSMLRRQDQLGAADAPND